MENTLNRLWFAFKVNLTPLNTQTFTVLDIETTGLDPRAGELLEVTAIRYRGSREIGKFTTLVKPERPIPEHSTRIHHITNDMVADAPDLKTAMKQLIRFVGPVPVLVGHYVNFDLTWLQHQLEKTGLEKYRDRFDPARALCTKTLAQRVFFETGEQQDSFSLTQLAGRFGIRNPNPHRAESDVRTTAQLLQALLAHLQQKKGQVMNTAFDILDFQGSIIAGHKDTPTRNR